MGPFQRSTHTHFPTIFMDKEKVIAIRAAGIYIHWNLAIMQNEMQVRNNIMCAGLTTVKRFSFCVMIPTLFHPNFLMMPRNPRAIPASSVSSWK